MVLSGRSVISSQSFASHSAELARIVLACLLLGAALAVAALPLEAAAGLVIGLIVVTLALVQPAAALGALLLALPLSTVATIEAGDFSVTVMEPLVALLVLAWVARGLTRRDLMLRGGPLLVPLGLLLLSLLVASLAAERVSLAYKEIVKWLELAVVLLFVVAHLGSGTSQRAILAVLFMAGSLEALFGVFQYATGSGPTAFAVGETLRAYGHFEQPNPFAGYLATILPRGLAMALLRRPRSFALLATVAVGCTGLGVLLSLSRGAWVGLLIALVAMLAAWGPATRRLLLPGAGAFTLVLLLTATNVLPGGWSDRLVAVIDNFGVFDVRTVEVSGENFAVVERMAHWQAGWYMLLDHPLLGVGPGNYPIAYEEYYLPGWREALGHAHNYYLNMAAEAGLPGATALLFLIVSVFATIMAGLRRHPGPTFPRALLVGLLGSFTVLTTHNLFDNLLVHGMQVQVGLLMGLAVLAAEQTPKTETPHADPRLEGAHSSPR